MGFPKDQAFVKVLISEWFGVRIKIQDKGKQSLIQRFQYFNTPLLRMTVKTESDRKAGQVGLSLSLSAHHDH